ncbi:MAG: hypothetical protein EHM34_03370 [Nitrosopumilales archaeon]|nr:MAG: hypothetical protein EHM34_03370 [Nitrosopumilales archaeon]
MQHHFGNTNELDIVLEKYFGDLQTKYFHPADAIFEDQYVSWEYHQHQRDKIVIRIGSNEGEVTVKIFTDPKELEAFIKLLIY